MLDHVVTQLNPRLADRKSSGHETDELWRDISDNLSHDKVELRRDISDESSHDRVTN